MHDHVNVVSQWTQRLRDGLSPSASDLRDHLLTVHHQNAGFTETLAWKCRDSKGRNSYELLADIIAPKIHDCVLDLACGSGVLLELCHQRYGHQGISLAGVDMSKAELELARARLADTNVSFHHGLAQQLDFIPDASVDVVLCHWALTLMEPLPAVIKEINRVLKAHGVFAAVVDGETGAEYAKINDIIYAHVQREYPNYGSIELGDPRVRSAEGLQSVALEAFPDAHVSIKPVGLCATSKPEELAREVSGFFYASFVLSAERHRQMIDELEAHFASLSNNIKNSSFTLPINLFVARKK